MLEWYENHTLWRRMMARRHNLPETGHTFYPAMIPLTQLFPWLDRMAGAGVFDTFGGWFGGVFNPRAWALWWQDRELYDLCTKKYLSPTIWRAIDMGKRKALRSDVVKETLRSQNLSLERAIKAKQDEMALQEKTKKKA